MVKEMCTKNSLPCLWKAFGVKIMIDRLYMTSAVDPVVWVYTYFIQHIYIHWLKVHDEKDQNESRA